MRPHIIGGNWKLQINSISEVKIRLTQILNDLQNKNINLSKIFIALPPALLHIGHELFKNSKINLAAQTFIMKSLVLLQEKHQLLLQLT